MRRDLASFLRELATDPLTPEEIARLPQRARDLLDGKPPPGVRKNGKIPKASAPGKTRAERDRAADANERTGKDAAYERAKTVHGLPQCEWYVDGKRCFDNGTEADHVLGGRWKKDMEMLPNGEGYQVMCHLHHQIEKHGGPKMPALLQAKEHAIRIGSPGLLRHVEKAIYRYNAKHPVPVRVEVKS